MKTKTLFNFNTRLRPGDQTPGRDGSGLNRFHSLAKRFAFTSCVAISLCSFSFTTRAGSNFIAHEWGTFTSVQGANGELLPWHASQTSELPGFVYNWGKPGMNRAQLYTGMKTVLTTLQRMETPVIYFYADQTMNVDVDVAFPKGVFTEWYPQTTQLGPTFPLSTNASLDGILHESRAVWRNLEIVPPSKYNAWLQDHLPQDSSGSHYFAARGTSANMVRADFTTPTNSTSEFEKFIFYRGSGSFKTPLRVTVGENDTVAIKNEGPEELAALFLITIHKTNGETYGTITSAKSLAGGRSIEWPLFGRLAHNWRGLPLAEFQSEVAAKIEATLTDQGLFPEEAKAMVNTWKDSWFTEEGVRVLYILPRAWTDETLPMKMTPQPKEITRVMVGRAEVITPAVEINLFQLLTKAQNGDATARTETLHEFKRLGRFAEPALALANTHSSETNVIRFGYQLLYPPQSQSTFE